MLRPLRDRIVVEMDESLPNAAGLLLAPDISKWREADDQIANRGVVVAVGPGKYDEDGNLHPVTVRVGETIRFSELEFYEHRENGKRYALISEWDVVGVEQMVQ